MGKALFTLEGSTSFVTVTHCCWEPKNTFINGKIGLASQNNILPSVEDLAGGWEYILRKHGFLSPRGLWGGSMLPSGVPAHLHVGSLLSDHMGVVFCRVPQGSGWSHSESPSAVSSFWWKQRCGLPPASAESGVQSRLVSSAVRRGWVAEAL